MSKQQQEAHKPHSKFSQLAFRATGQTSGHRTKYTYDRLGRQVSAVQGGTTVTYRRSLSGQLLSESYAGGPLNGLTVTNRYDQFLRRTNVATLNAQQTALNSVAYGYDTASRLSLARSGTLGIGYEYLANSPMVEHLYYTNNNVRRMITTKAYDRLNRLTSIASVNAQGAALSSHAYLYNAANQRKRATMADGSYWVYDYDSLGQVKSGKKYWADGTPVAGQQFEYGFDDIGNRTATKAGGDENGANLRSASYTPNLLNQYSSRAVPGAVDIMGVSFATNTVTVNGQAAYRKGEYFRKELPIANTSGPVWTNITVSATGQGSTNGYAFLPRTPEQFWYDTDGNLTNDGRWKYTWDAENRLVRMISGTTTGPQQRLDFGYDSQGRRITKKVWNNTAGSGTPALDERFVYDGWNLAAELNATNNAVVRGYVWGLDLSGSMQGAGGVGGLLAVGDPASGTNFCCFDGNGNVSVLVSATNASTTAQYEYGPFGELLRATGPMAKGNPFRFSTKYQDDESDLLYYGYRYLNTSIGRWLSRDPMRENGGPNLYGFVGNDPIEAFDILGEYSSSTRFSLAEMQAMLQQSKEDFRKKLKVLCPISSSVGWTTVRGEKQCCSPDACRVQAGVLTLEFARKLTVNFTTEYQRFGDVLAFTPMLSPGENINDRADKGPNHGMTSDAYNAGYGLKCKGMQSLIAETFVQVIGPLRKEGRQCFKGARVGNGADTAQSSHHWFGIYGPFNDDDHDVDVDADPWFSAGGIISPDGRYFGEARYFNRVLW